MGNSKYIIYQLIISSWCFLASCFAQNAGLEKLQLQLVQHPQMDSVRSNIITKLALAYHWVNKDSMYYYSEVLFREAQQSKDSRQLAQAHLVKGAYWHNIQTGKAISHLFQAQEIFKQLGDDKSLISVYHTIAITYDHLQEYDNQLAYLKNALQKAIDTGDRKCEITLLHDIAKAYFHLGNFALSREYTSMALQESAFNQDYMLDPIMIIRANIEFEKGDYQNSIRINEEILKRVKKEGETQLIMVCLRNIAECQIKLKQYTDARKTLQECLKNADSNKSTQEYKNGLQLLIALDTITENYNEAFRLQLEIEQLDTEKHALEYYSEHIDQVIQSELQETNSQLSFLESVYSKQKIRNENMNTLVITLLMIAVGSVVVIIILFRRSAKLDCEKKTLTESSTSIEAGKAKLTANLAELERKKKHLDKTNVFLEQADRSKTELFKTISRDLQQPLEQLQQDLTKLMVSDMNEAQFRLATDLLTSKVSDVSLLLESLLQWSKYQSQAIVARPQYIEMIMLVDDTINQLKYSAAEKGITMSNTLNHRLYVYADEEMMRNLLKIIVQNAIKLSGNMASISVSGEKGASDGMLRITYCGEMPLKDLHLQLFHTEGYDTRHSELGKAISLGWMLCRTLVEANNGKLWIEDIATDTYHVYISLPLEKSIAEKYDNL